MHIVTLSFDDGFRDSCIQVAQTYESFGLSACFNVLATGHWKSFISPDSAQDNHAKGDFQLWNELQARGHEIMPHGYKHANKSMIPFAESQQLILSCLDIFSKELAGFQPAEAVFNFPYNASTPELNAWLLSVVRAFRVGGNGINPLPSPSLKKLTCTAFGPGNCEHHLDAEIRKLLELPSGWLIYNTHGLGKVGWGPIELDYLKRLLERLVKISTVRVLPAGKALKLAGEL